MMETFKGSQIHGVAGILLTLALAYKLDEARQRNVLRSLDPEECYPILLLFFLPLHGKPFLEILKTALGVFYSEVVNEALPGSSKSLTKPGEEESSGTISQATFLYNYRARYFDPSQGRFLQTDPLGYQDSMNLYQGMGMNPVNFVDPFGKTIITQKSFKEKWGRIREYLVSNSKLAKTVIEFLELPKYEIYIFDCPGEQAACYAEKERNQFLIYDKKTKKKYEGKDVVLIDSQNGLRIFDEKELKIIGYQSVAMAVMHELIHVYHQKNNDEKYFAGIQYRFSESSPLYKWFNVEEKKTVSEESIVARDLGEAVRSYYNLMNKSGECVCLTAEEAFEKVTDVLQHENLTSNRGNDK